MKLPNGEHADLGSKLTDYVLNSNHREGRHKARVFESVLGVTQGNLHVLADAIVSAASNSSEAEFRGDNGYGEIYVLRFPMETDQRRAVVVTAWIVLYGEDFPRLVTCYIL